MFKRKLKIFRVSDYEWVIARSKREAIEWYSEWFDKEIAFGDEKYDPEECKEIDYNEKFFLDVYDQDQGSKPAKWFLKKRNLPKNTAIPGIIFSTEY